MRLACACGCDELMVFRDFGVTARGQDAGLVMILTCAQCGEQLRIHQTSPAYRDERAKLPALLAAIDDAQNCDTKAMWDEWHEALRAVRKAFT